MSLSLAPWVNAPHSIESAKRNGFKVLPRERGQVAVIGATNRRDLIDPALLRSGRFEVHIELGLPEQASRRKMLDITDVAIDEAVDLDELAARCDGLSFADMAGLLREAALVALRTDDSAMTVTWEHLETALAARGDGG